MSWDIISLTWLKIAEEYINKGITIFNEKFDKLTNYYIDLVKNSFTIKN